MNKPAPTDPRPGADLPPTDPRPLRVRTRRWTVRCPICSGSRPAQPVPDRTVATGGNHVLEINHPALLSPTSPGPHRTRESSRASVCVFQELLRPWSVYVTCSIRRSAGPRPGKDESSLARHEGHHEHGVGAGLARGGGRTKNGFEPAAWPVRLRRTGHANGLSREQESRLQPSCPPSSWSSSCFIHHGRAGPHPSLAGITIVGRESPGRVSCEDFLYYFKDPDALSPLKRVDPINQRG